MNSKKGFLTVLKSARLPITLILAASLLTGCANVSERSALPESESSEKTSTSVRISGSSSTSSETSLTSSEVPSASSRVSSASSGASSASSGVSSTSSKVSSSSAVSSKPVSSSSSASVCAHDFSREVLQYTTCAHTGKAKYTCRLCGYSEERTEDIKGGSYHNLVDEKVEPTCTDYGYTIHRCTDCSYVKIDNDYAHKLSHSYEDKVISQATKDSVGVVQKICSGCGKSQKEFFSNYFTDITYSSRKNAEADLAAMKLVEQLGLNIGNKTDLEKLCILKQWYCDNTSYDATYSKYSAYDILVDHTSVCQGYAESLCLILPKCGIETYICSSNKLNHAWNLAKIDGVWTYTDFVGGIGFNSENVILGSNAIGRTEDVIIRELDPSNGNNSGKTVNVSKSQIDQTLRLFMLDTTELDVIEGSGYYKYKIGNTTWTHTFKNN